MPFVIQLVWNNKQLESYLLTASLQHAEEAAQISAGAAQQRRPLIAVAVIAVTCNYHVQRMKTSFKKKKEQSIPLLVSEKDVRLH